eukprot:TRINITY_DN3456_c0_g1_i1.p1 TRINITY_DN3456_c0_g1~~TRINITY_DN3456_c0_g1_i1.p1  ORF type:complete len:335 (-),score=49.14 TRINITY_DN3456_c0_g1_i1:79-1083(-)
MKGLHANRTNWKITLFKASFVITGVLLLGLWLHSYPARNVVSTQDDDVQEVKQPSQAHLYVGKRTQPSLKAQSEEAQRIENDAAHHGHSHSHDHDHDHGSEEVSKKVVRPQRSDFGNDEDYDRKVMEQDAIVLHENNPRVLYWSNYLTPEECDEMIEAGAKSLRESQVVADESKFITGKAPGGERKAEIRSSKGSWLNHFGDEPFVQKFARRNSLWSGIPRDHGEMIQFLQYQVGQFYLPHTDWFDPVTAGQHLENGGQRYASVLCFLNDVEEGGETNFPKVNLSVPPTKGAAILWYNTFSNGTVDPMSLHGGNPVKKGVKYVAVQWLREKKRY